MTEQIKSAIADFQEWIDRAEEFNQNVQSDHVKAMKLAIRSLQAWEEVLQELEEQKIAFYQNGAFLTSNATQSIIDYINQHLEIEE